MNFEDIVVSTKRIQIPVTVCMNLVRVTKEYGEDDSIGVKAFSRTMDGEAKKYE